mgnify:CR=1 FL=1
MSPSSIRPSVGDVMALRVIPSSVFDAYVFGQVPMSASIVSEIAAGGVGVLTELGLMLNLKSKRANGLRNGLRTAASHVQRRIVDG